MGAPAYEGMPPTDRTFVIEPWGPIRCGGPCKDDYARIRAFHNKAGQLLWLQEPARDSFLAAQTKLGFAILVTGSIRTCELQDKLYRSDPHRFAPPAVTGHCRGLCIDVSMNMSALRRRAVKKALLWRDWHQSRPDDEPWHYSFGIKV